MYLSMIIEKGENAFRLICNNLAGCQYNRSESAGCLLKCLILI